MPHLHSHDDLLRLAFDEVRRAAASQPSVCVYLLEALRLLRDAAEETGQRQVPDAIAEQAELVVVGCEAAGLLPADVDNVRRAYRTRFGPDRAPASGSAN